MSVKTDIDRLEKQMGAPGMCQHGLRIVYDNDFRDDRPDPGPEVCPECGLERLTFKVRYEEDWGGTP